MSRTALEKAFVTAASYGRSFVWMRMIFKRVYVDNNSIGSKGQQLPHATVSATLSARPAVPLRAQYSGLT